MWYSGETMGRGFFGTPDCLRAREMRLAGMYVTSRVRCAARYAALVDVTIYDAAKVFGVSAGGVWHAWARIYPTIPQPYRLGM